MLPIARRNVEVPVSGGVTEGVTGDTVGVGVVRSSVGGVSAGEIAVGVFCG